MPEIGWHELIDSEAILKISCNTLKIHDFFKLESVR